MGKYEDTFWGDTAAQTKRKQNKRKKKKKSPWSIVALLFLLAFAVAGYFSFTMADKLLGDTFVSAGDSEEGSAQAAEKDLSRLNLLLVGADQREKEASRADTIIVSFINQETSEVNLLSIPRDTRVKVPGHGTTKINHAHAYGGPALLKQTVEDFLGVHVDYYAEVNFQGFENIVDILGGLEMDVEERMYYPQENIDLQSGPQKLNGYDALAYVRWRGDGTGDIGRIERQQKFLKATASEALSFVTIFKLPKLVDQAAENVRTDLPPGMLLPLAKTMTKVELSTIKSATLPGSPTWIDNVSYWQSDDAATAALLDQFYPQK